MSESITQVSCPLCGAPASSADAYRDHLAGAHGLVDDEGTSTELPSLIDLEVPDDISELTDPDGPPADVAGADAPLTDSPRRSWWRRLTDRTVRPGDVPSPDTGGADPAAPIVEASAAEFLALLRDVDEAAADTAPLTSNGRPVDEPAAATVAEPDAVTAAPPSDGAPTPSASAAAESPAPDVAGPARELPPLDQLLKELKLSGLLESLDDRVAEHARRNDGPVEFLTTLLADEVERRRAHAVERRVKQAHFEWIATLDDFDFSFNHMIPEAEVRGLAELDFLADRTPVVLHGPPGVGKTHLAQAIGLEACRAGHRVLFARSAPLLAELAAHRPSPVWRQRLRRLSDLDLLVLDDFAVHTLAPAESDALLSLVTDTDRRPAILVTSGREPGRWAEQFADPVVAATVLDRLVEPARVISLTGRSHRRL